MLKYTLFIGYGTVGKACHKAFEHNTEAMIIDPAHSTRTIQDTEIWRAPLAFVSVSAPTLDDKSVDASVIYSIFQQLADANYKGLVVLKSTLPPDIVYDLYTKFGHSKIMKKDGPLRYIYSPEFIREKEWERDAISQHFIIVAGDFHDCKELEDLYRNHSQVNKYARFHIVDYKVAALAKYAINSYLATKVVFMNQLRHLYLDMYGSDHMQPESWKEFIGIMGSDPRIGTSHLDVPGPDGKFGYGGSCFPKDIKAMIGFDFDDRLSIVRETDIANTRLRLTGDVNEKNIP